jgi:predicted HNH restriction endonuclease
VEVHKHIRKFYWVKKGEWEAKKRMFRQKTLTDITSTVDKIEEIKKLVGFEETDIIYPDTLEESEKYPEGAKKQITVNSYERNPDARKKCIDHFGAICSVCDFNFEKIYGGIGEGFIHVHHLVEIHTKKGEEYKVDPIKDLIPVCPNCHAMLHKRKKHAYSIDELRGIISNN